MAMLYKGKLATPPHRLASSTPAGTITAPTAKPHLTGTSNVGCADAYRMKRRGNRPLHSPNHTDCNAVDDATFLSVSSIPGLSTANMHYYKFPASHAQTNKGMLT